MNRSTWNLPQQNSALLNITANVLAPPLRVLCASATYLCLCPFVTVLASVMRMVFLLLSHTYARFLSCICVLLVGAMCA